MYVKGKQAKNSTLTVMLRANVPFVFLCDTKQLETRKETQTNIFKSLILQFSLDHFYSWILNAGKQGVSKRTADNLLIMAIQASGFAWRSASWGWKKVFLSHQGLACHWFTLSRRDANLGGLAFITVLQSSGFSSFLRLHLCSAVGYVVTLRPRINIFFSFSLLFIVYWMAKHTERNK